MKELVADQKELENTLRRILKVTDDIAKEEAKAYANSTKGRIETLQKEEKARQTLSGIQQQELKNSILQLQYAGQITEKEAKRRDSLAEISTLANDIASKQKVLNDIVSLDPKNTEEITKVRGEIAQLQGKKVQVEIQVKKEAFEQFVQNLERTTTIRTNALNLESAVLQANLAIDQARNGAEQSRLSYVLQGLQAKKEEAKSDGERIKIASQIAAIQKAIAENEYRSALIAIDTGIRQAQIEFEKLKLKEAELRVVIAQARAQGILTDAHWDALRAAQAALSIGKESLRNTEQSAVYQRESAEWARKSAYQQANLALNAERTAKATKSAASAAGDYANNLQRAAAGMSYSRPGLEDWQERYIAKLVNEASANRKLVTFADRVNLESQLFRYFNQGRLQAQATSDTQQLQEFQAKYGAAPYGSFGMFASGGYVTGPTLGLIGEGGQSEYIIPASKMATASANYLAGGRGASIMEGGGSGGAPVINISTGPVLEFNGQRYITVGDFERGMRNTATSVINALRTPSARYSTGIR